MAGDGDPAVARRKRHGMTTRAVAAVVDEGLSSLQNFAIVFPALHFFSVSGLGEFTLAYTLAILIKVILKSLLLEPLTIRYSAARHVDQQAAGAHAAGASVVVGVLLAVIAALGSAFVSGQARWLVIAVGATVPALLVQEAWRVYFYAIARPWKAAANDLLCLITTVILVGWLATRDASVSPVMLLALWALGNGVGAIAGTLQAGLIPSVRQTWFWLRTHADLGGRLAGATGVTQASGQLALTLVAVIGGSVALGRLSAARTLVMPMTTVTTSAVTFALPEAARLRATNDGRLRWLVRGLSASLVAAFSAFGAVAFLIPTWMGELIAGSNWQTARSLLLPVVLAGALAAMRQGPRVGLRVFEQQRTILALAAVSGVATVGATAAGTVIAGATGAAWGFVMAEGISAIAWWTVYQRCERREFDSVTT